MHEQLSRFDGTTPEELLDYNTNWSGQKQLSIYGQSAFEVFGHCLVGGLLITHHHQPVYAVGHDQPECVSIRLRWKPWANARRRIWITATAILLIL